MFDNYDHRYALEKFIADQTRNVKNYYVSIGTIYTRFRPSERLFRDLVILESKKYIFLDTDDDDIRGAWGNDELFKTVDRDPKFYAGFADYTEW